MLQLIQSQKALVTMIIFIATYFASLTIGRMLKRRAGVPLGLLFQLFCLTLAFYAAMWFYGVQADWRNHVGALLFLLSTALFVALLDRDPDSVRAAKPDWQAEKSLIELLAPSTTASVVGR